MRDQDRDQGLSRQDRDQGLSQDELEQQAAEDLPDREAMSVISPSATMPIAGGTTVPANWDPTNGPMPL